MTELSDEEAEAFRLNMQAFRALVGTSSTPEADIAALLASHHVIDEVTRMMLADALTGRSEGIELRATGKAKTKLYRSFAARKAAVLRARQVLKLQATGMSYDDAIGQMAEQSGKSRSSVEANVTLANKAATWANEMISRLPQARVGQPISEALSSFLGSPEWIAKSLDDETFSMFFRDDFQRLEDIFLYADAANKPATQLFDRCLELLPSVTNMTEAMHRAAREP